MATNEHKNLDNDNLHLPLDFSSAGINTIPSKNGDSELEWISESVVVIGVSGVKKNC